MFDPHNDDDDVRLPGSLMAAHPQLKDPNFVRSVILMTSDEEEGSLGVVVNKSAGLTLSEVDPSFNDFGLGDVPLFIGGPVGEDQIILAGWRTDAEAGQFNLFFGLEPSAAQARWEADPSLKIRAYRGYAGWGKGQLDEELSSNAWVLSEMDSYALSELQGERLWRHVILSNNLELGLMSLAPEPPDLN